MSAIVFGEVDPLDYREALCSCGHERSDHDADDGPEPCWHGWHDSVEGCQCMEYVPDTKTGHVVA